LDFGFYLPCYWPDLTRPADQLYSEMLAQARHADELGFVSVSIPEHHFINYLTHPSTLLTAVKVAAVTSRVKILTAIIVLPFYDVRRLAGEVAQTDCFTDGRLQIGVGRGAFRYEFDRLGVKFEDSREMFVDSLQLLIKLLTETDVAWKSRYYEFDSLTTMPRPVQKPHPPIWVAAVAPEAIYSSVKFGNHVMTTPLRDPFEAAKAQAEAFFKAVDEDGEKARHLKLSTLRMIYVGRTEADIRAKRRLALENHKRFTDLYETPGHVIAGAVQPLESIALTEDELEKALIIGSPDYCLDKLMKYGELGIHNMQVNSSFGASHDDVMRSMELFASHVMPNFAGTPGSV